MKILDLFSGTQSIASVFRERGWETFTLDFNLEFTNTDWQVDILQVTAQDILERFGKPDVIWASPPCTTFSVASIGRHWNKNHTPKTPEAEIGLQILFKTVELIKELQPKYFFIENPRGKMRKMPIMEQFNRHTVTYCQYGDTRMKPTDLWTNHPNPNFKPICKNGYPCHVAAPRGSKTGTQGLKGSVERSKLPRKLCEHIFTLASDNE